MKKIKIVHKAEQSVTAESDIIEKSLYSVLDKVPTVPAKFNLTTNQKYWWKWFATEFITTKQFSKVDLIHLHQASFWLDARCAAYEMINLKNKEGSLKGMVQTFKGGATNITGWMSVVKDADKALDNISAHFGLSFKDRNKLGKIKKVDENQLSLFDQFKNRNQHIS